MELAEIPEWLNELLYMKKEIKPAEPVDEKITRGSRNSTLASLAGTMQRRGMSQEAITAALEAENQGKCVPALDRAEVARIAASVCKYAPAEAPKQTSGRKLINIESILTKPDPNKEIEPVEWIIPGMAARGDVVLLMGPQKGGKTMLAARGSCEVSSGGNFLDGFAWVEPHKVLYLMYDNVGEARFYGRIKKAGWTFNPDNIRFVFNENIRRQGGNMDLDKHDSLFETLIHSWEPDLVFIDTLGSAHDKNENRNDEMKPILDKLTGLTRELNNGLIVLHHTRKRRAADYGVAMQSDDSVGAGIILRLASSIIGVKKVVGEDQKELYTVKNLGSWHKEFQPFEFSLIDEADDQGQVWLRMPVNLSAGIDKTSQDMIMRVIKANYWDGEQFTRQNIVKRTKLSSVTVSSVLNKLTAGGVLLTEGNTKDKTFSLPLKITQ